MGSCHQTVGQPTLRCCVPCESFGMLFFCTVAFLIISFLLSLHSWDSALSIYRIIKAGYSFTESSCHGYVLFDDFVFMKKQHRNIPGLVNHFMFVSLGKTVPLASGSRIINKSSKVNIMLFIRASNCRISLSNNIVGSLKFCLSLLACLLPSSFCSTLNQNKH